MKILVVGGAGYIGSHMVKMLLNSGHKVITLDNLSNGHRDAVLGGTFIEGDLANIGCLNQLFDRHRPEAVMHFASYIQVGESIKKPDIYYQNNVCNTLNLVNSMLKFDITKFIFSSTAAVFGEPIYVPIDEVHPHKPLNPYGRSKLIIEQVLADYDRAFNFRFLCLRYFNAAGADPEGQLGERHYPETHLIPLVIQAASGRHNNIQIFGSDYDTPDGTCIRDYIHITDLCSAHLAALEYLNNGGLSDLLNLGNGVGFSVQEIIDTVKKVSGREVAVIKGPRREGDPARLVADAKRAKSVLNWHPNYTELESIISHAWLWEMKCRMNCDVVDNPAFLQ